MAPDAVFVSPRRADIVREDPVRGMHDLAVEVLSPSTRAGDLGPKLGLCQRAGVPIHWVADPAARAVAVYRRAAAGRFAEPRVLGPGDCLDGERFPAIAAPVSALFGA